jgi:hypothetical protein
MLKGRARDLDADTDNFLDEANDDLVVLCAELVRDHFFEDENGFLQHLLNSLRDTLVEDDWFARQLMGRVERLQALKKNRH